MLHSVHEQVIPVEDYTIERRIRALLVLHLKSITAMVAVTVALWWEQVQLWLIA